MGEEMARVQQFFAARGFEIRVETFATRVHTAQQAAEALGTTPDRIVKSLVFEADGRPVLVLCGGDRRVDIARLAALCGARQVRKASAAVIERVTGYRIGGVPPVAHATALPVFMDAARLTHDTVYAAAGTAHSLFAMAPRLLRDLSGARVAALSVDHASHAKRPKLCPYLRGMVELTEERERHIAEHHPDLLPAHLNAIVETLADPDTVRRSARFESARLFARWFDAVRGGKFVVVVVLTDKGPADRHWIVTAYIARRLTGGEVEWQRS